GGNQDAAAILGVRGERLAAATFQSARRQEHHGAVRRQASSFVRARELRAAGSGNLIGASRSERVLHVKRFTSKIATRRHNQHRRPARIVHDGVPNVVRLKSARVVDRRRGGG